MKVRHFCKEISRMIPCHTVYYPEDRQVVVCTNVNNKDVTLCYDEEFIEYNYPDTIFAVVEDDLFSIGKDINISGRI